MLLDQTIDRIPLAMDTVETPFLMGNVDALSMENTMYDLTIVNVEGCRIPTLEDFRIYLA